MEISGLEGHWGVNYSAEACSHCVKVCLVVLLLKRELDSLLECLRWWRSGWPPLLVTMWVILDFRIWVIFLQGEKFWGEQKFARLLALNFTVCFFHHSIFNIDRQNVRINELGIKVNFIDGNRQSVIPITLYWKSLSTTKCQFFYFWSIVGDTHVATTFPFSNGNALLVGALTFINKTLRRMTLRNISKPVITELSVSQSSSLTEVWATILQFAECLSANCDYAECRGALLVKL